VLFDSPPQSLHRHLEDRMSTARPGIALRNLRKSNRWTLADVSKRTGIPPSTLSRIENDQLSPTYDLLVRLSSGLRIDLTQLLAVAKTSAGSAAEQAGRRSVNRKEDGEIVRMPHHTLRYLSNDLLNKQITPILSEYRARSLEEFGELMRHEGEEFLYVIEGELELHTECYAPLILKPGESVYFDSRMGHAYIARSEGFCQALSICTVPQPAEQKLTPGSSAGAAATSDLPKLVSTARVVPKGTRSDRAGRSKHKVRRTA
jgi:transcriptional regulator with XRE-family HTH domain